MGSGYASILPRSRMTRGCEVLAYLFPSLKIQDFSRGNWCNVQNSRYLHLQLTIETAISCHTALEESRFSNAKVPDTYCGIHRLIFVLFLFNYGFFNGELLGSLHLHNKSASSSGRQLAVSSR